MMSMIKSSKSLKNSYYFVDYICCQTKNGFSINNKVNYYSAILTTWLKTCLNMLHWEPLMTIDHEWILIIVCV
jgi:hypothetical protein